MILWKKITLIITFTFGLMAFAVLTETYSVRVPVVFQSRYYSDNLLKFYGGKWQGDFAHFNENFVSGLADNVSAEIHLLPTGYYFLRLVNHDTGEVSDYLGR